MEVEEEVEKVLRGLFMNLPNEEIKINFCCRCCPYPRAPNVSWFANNILLLMYHPKRDVICTVFRGRHYMRFYHHTEDGLIPNTVSRYLSYFFPKNLHTEEGECYVFTITANKFIMLKEIRNRAETINDLKDRLKKQKRLDPAILQSAETAIMAVEAATAQEFLMKAIKHLDEVIAQMVFSLI